jgi:hypothetical protein
MSRTRFQFTIRGIMWATFWVAVSLAGWVTFINPSFGHMAVLRTASFSMVLFAPCAAVGFLTGYPIEGMNIGFILAATLVAFITVITIGSGFPY